MTGNPSPIHRGCCKGQTLTEYTFIFLGVVVVAIIALQVLGFRLTSIYNASITPNIAAAGTMNALAPVNQSVTGASTQLSGTSNQVSLPGTVNTGIVTINPVTGQPVPTTGGASANTNATSVQGQNSVGTMQLANTIRLMALSGNYSAQASNDLLALADSLWRAGALQGIYENNSAYTQQIPTVSTRTQSGTVLGLCIFCRTRTNSNPAYSQANALYELNSVQQTINNYYSGASSLSSLSPTDQQVLGTLISQANTIMNSYYQNAAQNNITANRPSQSFTSFVSNYQGIGSQVLQTNNASQPVLVTLNTAQTVGGPTPGRLGRQQGGFMGGGGGGGGSGGRTMTQIAGG